MPEPGGWLAATELSVEEAVLVNNAMYNRWASQSAEAPPLSKGDMGWADLWTAAYVSLKRRRESNSSEKPPAPVNGTTDNL